MYLTTNNKHALFLTLALATFIVSTIFIWQGNKGFSLWDEGFLWYGAQRTMLGEVPIRDFLAYDPGRYYWSATLMSIFGNNGIISLRVTVAIFQTFGLFIGLFLISISTKKQNLIYLLLSCAVLFIWMLPRHKLFDISLSIFIIGILTFLIENPTNKRFFITGFCIGLIAFFGRNHGLYAVLGMIGVMLWLNIKKNQNINFLKNFLVWITGVIIGFSPMILMIVFVPGFALAFLDSIRFLFEIKATNLPLPIPWPWLIQFNTLPFNESIRGFLVGIIFIGVLVFGVLSIAWVFLGKIKNKQIPSAFVATSFLALPYAQFAYSRADVSHLAQGIFPFLIGGLVLLSSQPSKIKWSITIMFCIGSVWILLAYQPDWQCIENKQCVEIKISNNKLEVDPSTANDVALLRKLVNQYAPNNESFIAAPFWPGAYALLDRKSPMWEIYALFPRSQAFEQTEIERIKKTNPRFAIVLDIPLDGHNELRFKNTHPLIHQYIVDNFDLIPNSLNQTYQIYKSKEGSL
ncbi:hypothetical protein [Solimicrobium silvestre]|uniref:Dolichyl-phosphate-mannose-protein mannosyltransferase n=1 Tax=Solimicrobium silvestre TaxID=2099400 RepID=A0A2S9H0Q4_9BURK|nr:hypothetical protein [Solimicrobium silvestre]PRC93559.1 hypothetical protein S2091_1560 [Solimicrobium silvestre]